MEIAFVLRRFYGNTFRGIYGLDFWIVFGILFGMPVLWGMFVGLLERRGPKAGQYLNMILGVAYTFFIIFFTVIARTPADQGAVLIPFHFLAEAQKEPELYRSMLMNILLYLPFGLTLPLALPRKVPHRIWCTVLSAMALSALIEISQYLLKIGRCEVDDVMMNSFGALIGCLAYVTSHIDNERLMRLFALFRR